VVLALVVAAGIRQARHRSQTRVVAARAALEVMLQQATPRTQAQMQWGNSSQLRQRLWCNPLHPSGALIISVEAGWQPVDLLELLGLVVAALGLQHRALPCMRRLAHSAAQAVRRRPREPSLVGCRISAQAAVRQRSPRAGRMAQQERRA